MLNEVHKEINRIDKLDTRGDKKVSVVEGREKEFTDTYITKVETLISKLNQLENEKQREKAAEKLFGKLLLVNKSNIVEIKDSFDRTMDQWINEVNKALANQEYKKEKESAGDKYQAREKSAEARAISGMGEIEKDILQYANAGYIEIIRTPTSLEIKLTDNFSNLGEEQQMAVLHAIEKIKTNISLKKEEILMETEENEYMKSFYRANKFLSEGNYIKAKKEYKKFIEGSNNPNILPEKVQQAVEALKMIAKFEANKASARLDMVEKSVESYSMNRFPESKFGCEKAYAQKCIIAQRLMIQLALQQIENKKDVLSFEDAIKAVEHMPVEEIKKIDISGAADKITFYSSHFNTDPDYRRYLFDKNQKYIPQLDAIRAVIEEEGAIDQATLTKIAENYREIGMYQAAEETYDLYFRDLYKKFAVEDLDKSQYIANFRKDPEKMERINQQIAKQEEEMEKREGKVLSPEEKEIILTRMIENEWKKDLRFRITEQAKSGNIDPETAEKWEKFNNDYLQVDRDWYEIWKFTAKEWDEFIDTLPIDIASLIITTGVAGAAEKAVTSALAKKMIVKELEDLGIKEAFEQGGKVVATRVLMTRLAGYAAEALTFSEMSIIETGFRTRDFSTMMNLEEHLKNWGHGVLTLATLKVMSPLKLSPIKKPTKAFLELLKKEKEKNRAEPLDIYTEKT